MSAPEMPKFYRHEDQPEWGRGLLLKEQDSRRYFFFEDGQTHYPIQQPFWSKLIPVDLPENEAVALASELQARMESAAGKRPASSRPAKKPAVPARPLKTTISFEAQVRLFEEDFPGGFRGERFTLNERGLAEGRGYNGYKERAIVAAREALNVMALEDGDPTRVFARVKGLFSGVNIAFPQEGSIALSSMKPEDYPAFVQALRELLHGPGEADGRFDRFVASLRLWQKDGQPRRPTWPLATYFRGLFDPKREVIVKVKSFQDQAQILGWQLDYNSLPSAVGYARFVRVAQQVEERLRSLGHDPRDLMDVYSFIWVTLSPNARKKTGAEAKTEREAAEEPSPE